VDPNDSDGKLFVSLTRDHKPVTVQTISRWIKTVLSKSGVDTSVFKGHSTRHASSSSALKQGIAVDIIRARAGWTPDSNVFARFYNRPVDESLSFANAVFSAT